MRRALTVLLVALLLLAAAAAGWRLVYRPVQARLAAVESGLAALRAETAALTLAQGRLAGRVGGAEAALGVVQETVDRLHARTGRLDHGWRVLEAEHLLRTAAEVATLRHDPRAARAALASADAALRATNDPVWLPVREDIAAARTALAAAPWPDVAGTTYTLQALARSLADAPLRGEPVPVPTPAPGARQAPDLWQRVGEALREVFVLRRVERSAAALGPEAGFFVRETLRLRFAQAELDLARLDTGSFHARLQAVAALLRDHYDSDAAAVAHARRELARLARLNLAPPVPDLAVPLQRLRAIRAAARVQEETP